MEIANLIAGISEKLAVQLWSPKQGDSVRWIILNPGGWNSEVRMKILCAMSVGPDNVQMTMRKGTG